MRIIGGLLLCVASVAAANGASAPRPPELKATSRAHGDCVLASNILYRLAEHRDAGVSTETAIDRVNDWVGRLGQTGSHLRSDYRKAVATSAKFAYQQADLNPVGIAAYGFRSCQMNWVFAKDELRRDVAQARLLEATLQCQQAHPGRIRNRPLAECVRDRGKAITERVWTARVEE